MLCLPLSLVYVILYVCMYVGGMRFGWDIRAVLE